MRPREHDTDEELVRLLLTTRDEELRTDFWVEFWRRFQPTIAGVIVKRFLRCAPQINRADVDDLVCKTFLKLYEHDFRILRNFEFRHEKALPAFLKVVALHIVEDHFRDDNEYEELDPDTTLDRSDFIGAIDRRMKLEKIENCLQKLADKPNFARDYKAFWLHNREGVTAEEILKLPDMGFNTVKGVESALLRLNRWVLQCLHREKAKKSSSSTGGVS
jgi:DNA-directed RNA polymerase specialized sigma24 family protein